MAPRQKNSEHKNILQPSLQPSRKPPKRNSKTRAIEVIEATQEDEEGKVEPVSTEMKQNLFGKGKNSGHYNRGKNKQKTSVAQKLKNNEASKRYREKKLKGTKAGRVFRGKPKHKTVLKKPVTRVGGGTRGLAVIIVGGNNDSLSSDAITSTSSAGFRPDNSPGFAARLFSPLLNFFNGNDSENTTTNHHSKIALPVNPRPAARPNTWPAPKLPNVVPRTVSPTCEDVLV